MNKTMNLNRLAVTTATDMQKSTPGFEEVFALVDLIAVFCLVRFGKNRYSWYYHDK